MKVIIAAVLLLKNEENHVLKTLISLPKEAEIVVVNDTGSTDKTEHVVREFCKDNDKECVYISSKWQDFSTNRNKSWAAVPDRATHILLLDASDEVQIKNENWVDELSDETLGRFLVTQKWWNGNEMIEYKNFRLLKNIKGHEYRGVVHEALYSCPEDGVSCLEKEFEGFLLYQDRTKDGGQSSERFLRDLVLLKDENDINPKNPRTVFYLAQTYSCLNRKDEAAPKYRERLELLDFDEERFISAMWLANYYSDPHFAKLALEIDLRAEPLIFLCNHHRAKKDFNAAYSYIKAACDLELPKCRLWFKKYDYDYERWHLMGIVAWYVKSTCGSVKEHGRKALETVLMYLSDQPETKSKQDLLNLNISNIKFYLQ